MADGSLDPLINVTVEDLPAASPQGTVALDPVAPLGLHQPHAAAPPPRVALHHHRGLPEGREVLVPQGQVDTGPGGRVVRPLAAVGAVPVRRLVLLLDVDPGVSLTAGTADLDGAVCVVHDDGGNPHVVSELCEELACHVPAAAVTLADLGPVGVLAEDGRQARQEGQQGSDEETHRDVGSSPVSGHLVSGWIL